MWSSIAVAGRGETGRYPTGGRSVAGKAAVAAESSGWLNAEQRELRWCGEGATGRRKALVVWYFGFDDVCTGILAQRVRELVDGFSPRPSCTWETRSCVCVLRCVAVYAGYTPLPDRRLFEVESLSVYSASSAPWVHWATRS